MNTGHECGYIIVRKFWNDIEEYVTETGGLTTDILQAWIYETPEEAEQETDGEYETVKLFSLTWAVGD